MQFGRNLASMPFDEERPRTSGPRLQASGFRPAAVGLAWFTDAVLLATLWAGFVYLAGRACRVTYWLDFTRDTSPLLAALLGLLAVAYSFVFVVLGGRTPGMAAAGLRVTTLHGDDPTPIAAFVRALLSLPSAALGLFGFALAVFDARGQTLHDKLCRCVVRID
jgi:uncharacterized RDD family membrane protein YckC